MSETDLKVVSPCVSLCCLDEEGLCMGCFRHVDEITGWRSMNDDQRRELLVVLDKRREQAGPQKY